MTRSRTTTSSRLSRSTLGFAALAVAALIAALSPATADAQSDSDFPELTAGQRVYDTTGISLSSSEIMDLEQRLQDLEAVGANAIVYVRAFNATPEETLQQVEALQRGSPRVARTRTAPSRS